MHTSTHLDPVFARLPAQASQGRRYLSLVTAYITVRALPCLNVDAQRSNNKWEVQNGLCCSTTADDHHHLSTCVLITENIEREIELQSSPW